VTELAPPRSYAGYNIWGNYRLQAPAQEAYFRVGSRIVKLEPLLEEDFEWLAAKTFGWSIGFIQESPG